MAREFQANTGNVLDLGDVVDARTLRANVWSILAFVRPRTVPAGDQGTIWMKHTSADVRNLGLRVTQGSPASVEVLGELVLTPGGATSLNVDTWYLTHVSCEGDEAANDLSLSTVGMDGVFIDDDLQLTHPGDRESPVTGDFKCGRQGTAADGLDAAIFALSYFKNREFTKQDILNYLHNPYRVARQYGSDCVFFLKMPENDSPERDWSGNGNDAIVTGTAYGIVANPPVAPLIGFGRGWQGAAAAAGTNIVVPVA